MIPKIIWQTHENKYQYLSPFQKNIANTWQNLNPGWEYRYVNAEQRYLEVKEYSDIAFNYYTKADKIHQADIWRYITIYKYGGFYADMDSICTQSIDEALLKNYKGEELVCSTIGHQHFGVNNSNFGAVKNSKIIKLMLDSLIIKYENMRIDDIHLLEFGVPENRLFSSVAIENKDIICFNNDYFMHSSDFKKTFNENVDIIFNGEKMNYGSLCKTMNWPIYYI
jgi:hypothetical protein